MDSPFRVESRTALALLLSVTVVAAALALAACGGKSATATASTQPPSGGAAASPMPTPTPPEYSAPGTIAFIKDRDLYTIWTNGASLRRIAEDVLCTAWSPDGDRIACGSGNGLFVLKADGSDSRRVATGRVGGGVAWSPDGGQIVFGAPGGYFAKLEIVNADGSGRRDVTSFPPGGAVLDVDPAWSPTGRIFFGRLDKNGIGEISAVNPDGSDLGVVTAAGPLPRFSLSPDGKWLLIWERRSLRCVRMEANGHGAGFAVLDRVRERKRILYGYGTSWSPDGSRIVFAAGYDAWSGPSTGLYIVRADGSRLRRVPNTEDALAPAWRP